MSDDMTNADIFTADELYEMDRDAEYQLDAQDEAHYAEHAEAEERGEGR